MTQQILSSLLQAIFLSLPPILLALRFWKKSPSWWLIGLSLPVISWICINGMVWLHNADITRQMNELEAAGEPIPEDLMEAFANDGGRNVFALFFGWLYVVPFFLGWMIPFGIGQAIRKSRQKKQ
ncbi:MAG: hypothetical protein KDN20_11355 [Verrucomicrobiae bacterium]|nr:hypothetical protein [Verrucomicrobiae bacterium]